MAKFKPIFMSPQDLYDARGNRERRTIKPILPDRELIKTRLVWIEEEKRCREVEIANR